MTEHNNPQDNVTVSRELLRQVLDALEAHADIGIKSDKQISALRNALEQPAVEPSAVFYRCNHCWHGYEDQPPSSCDCSTGYGFERVEYFTSPQAQQPAPVQENSYEWQCGYLQGVHDGMTKTRPAQQPRKAVKLTHEQAKALAMKYSNDPLHLIFQTEVAVLKKNGVTK